MTKRMKAALEFIAAYWREHGWGPSYADIAASIGSKSRGDISNIVRTLERRGYLFREIGASRSVRIANVCTKCGEPQPCTTNVKL